MSPVPVRSATLPLSVHEGVAFMDRQGGNRGREAFVQRRSGDNPDFPALQGPVQARQAHASIAR
ncbi:MAG: hypothetical protein OXF73_09780, partial [Gammaproteobacteria bacterium]|nr:hypothetical protein [Gammaproteobacteria bacterium]